MVNRVSILKRILLTLKWDIFTQKWTKNFWLEKVGKVVGDFGFLEHGNLVVVNLETWFLECWKLVWFGNVRKTLSSPNIDK